MTVDIMARVPEIQAKYNETVVAVVLDHDGTVFDHCFNWQTAQNYALSEGRKVIAIADDDHYMTKDKIQALCDSERALYNDCYGIKE